MVGEAHRKGYSVALTTIAPVRPWWPRWLKFFWRRVVPWLGPKGMKHMDKLAILNSARWSLIEREPGAPPGADARFPRAYLLFESNFNGNTDHYLESFVMVSLWTLRATWGWWKGSGAYYVPDPAKVSKFIDYVNDNRARVLHHYSAYPEASTKTVRIALRTQELLVEFQAEAHNADAGRLNRAWEQLLTRVEEINDPPEPRRGATIHSFTAMTRLKEDAAQLHEFGATFEGLGHDPEHMPATTHFARWSYVDSLKPPPGMKRDPTHYLIFSAWFDGPLAEYLTDLYTELGSDRVHHIWGPCGYAGADGPQFKRFLLDHVVEQGMPMLGYDGVTVQEVLWALERANRLARASVELQAMRGDDLRDQLRQRKLLE
jgi:hypothetical protein